MTRPRSWAVWYGSSWSVIEIATRGSRSMLRAFSEPSWVKKTTLSPSSPAQIAVELGEPSLVSVARWAKFAFSNSSRTSGGSSAISASLSARRAAAA